ncbi:MAG: hypothetical protein H6876_03860 [Hyphomicrobiaceae bacterium]|nr:hypothetical protein [Hyphomicrobiaceae bacterium]
MSEVCVASDRFWREFRSDVAGTLTDEQRGEIERCLGQSTGSGSSALGDLRLSFKWFFVRLAWGPEKRNSERIKQDQKSHPVMSRRNAPMLASLLAGYMALSYVVVGLAVLLLAYFIS